MLQTSYAEQRNTKTNTKTQKLFTAFVFVYHTMFVTTATLGETGAPHRLLPA